jgi:hypothetical protein
MVREHTGELQKMVNLMAGREARMAELKKVIEKLRAQLESAGMTPVADDPLKEMGRVKSDFGFWILDFGLQIFKSEILNLRSKIDMNLKSKGEGKNEKVSFSNSSYLNLIINVYPIQGF